jgi:hypothetical protein
MGLFSRRRAGKKKTAFDTGNPADDQLLGIIAERSDLTKPRHWVHYLYFPDERNARLWADSIESAGWNIQEAGPAATDNGQWIVIPERHDFVVSPDAVKEARGYFESIVAQVARAEYDGWEASL